MQTNNQLDARIMLESDAEALLDNEDKLIDYVRETGTASLQKDAINWYFRNLIATFRNYQTEGERAEADRRLKGLMNALLQKDKKMGPDKKKLDGFLCFDAVTQMKAETLNETVKDNCDLFCHSRRGYAKCEIRQKTFGELKKEEKCSEVIQKLRSLKYDDDERVLSDNEIQDFFTCKNASEYVHKVMIREYGLQPPDYYKAREFGLKNLTKEQAELKLKLYMIADCDRRMIRAYKNRQKI